MKTFFNRLSIKTKIVLLSSFLALLTGIMVFGIFPFQQKRIIMDEFRTHSIALTKMTADNIRTSIEFGDRDTANEILGVLTGLENFSFAVVKDRAGRVFAAIPSAVEIDRYMDGIDHRSITETYCKTVAGKVIATIPVYASQQPIGTLTIGFSLTQIDAQISETFRVALAVTLGLIVFMILCSLVIARVISNPIGDITKTALAITRGDLRQRVKTDVMDETGLLAKAFNEMTENLSATITSLSASEKTYRLHFENISDLIFVVDSGLTITEMSPSSERLTGFAPQAFTGKAVGNLLMFSPESLQNLRRDVAHVTRGIGSLESEYEITTVSGDKKIFETILTHIHEDDTVLCVGRDVTERRRSLQELKSTKEFLDNIIENSIDGIVVTDETGTIIRVNRAFAAFLGYAPEQCAGRHVVEFSPGGYGTGTFSSKTGETVTIDRDFLGMTARNNETLLEKGRVSNWETYLMAQDQKLVPVEMSVVMLLNEQGEWHNSVAVVREITQRKVAEKNLNDTKEFLSSVIEGSRDIILITDNYGVILSVNSSFEKTTGYPRDEFIGKHASELVVQDRELRESIKNKTEELLTKGYAAFEAVWETDENRYIDVECVSSMLKDETGGFAGAVTVVRDVTERKKMEQQMVQSEKLKSLGELAAGIAHDFNNNLAAILGRAQLLRRLVEKNREHFLGEQLLTGLKLIEKASIDGSETVRRIQEFSRRGTEETSFMVVDVNELVEDALEFTRPLWKDDAEARNIKINIARQYTLLPPVEGSPSELREVFTNCIKNAVEALPGGGDITVGTFSENGFVCVSITDTGVGIPETFKQRVFDPFYTTKGPRSSGLGMSMSYGIIGRHRGTIGFESMEEKGTTFTIRLPVLTKSPFAARKDAVKTFSPPGHAAVLVIDDEEDVRNTLSDILTEEGYRVTSAASGEEGLKLFMENGFDVVFTDLGMPGLSGYQVAEKIAGIKQGVPVVLVTGWQVTADSTLLRQSGIFRVVSKPFQIDSVLGVMQACLEKK